MVTIHWFWIATFVSLAIVLGIFLQRCVIVWKFSEFDIRGTLHIQNDSENAPDIFVQLDVAPDELGKSDFVIFRVKQHGKTKRGGKLA